MKLNKYNTSKGKFILEGQEFSLNQIIQLQQILKKLGNLDLAKIYQNLKSKYDGLEDKSQVDAKNLKSTVAAAKKDAAVELAYRKIFFNSKLPAESMRLFNTALDTHLTIAELGVIFQPKLTPGQINVAMNGLILGLNTEQVSIFLSSKLSVNQMEVLKGQLLDDIPMGIVAMFAKPDISPGDMKDLISNALKDIKDLTPEDLKRYFKAAKEDYELSKLVDVNIEMDDAGKFEINGKKILQSDLEELLALGGDPRTFPVRIAIATDEVIPKEIKTVMNSAISADLGIEVIKEIGKTEDLQNARNIFTTAYKDVTGKDIKYGRDLKKGDRDQLYHIQLERTKR